MPEFINKEFYTRGDVRMRVLIAMDSFKGTFNSLEAADIVEKGIRKVYSSAYIDKVGIADGGEGTVEVLVKALKGEYIFKEVSGPLGKKVNAKYGIINNRLAIMEMAEACGLYLIPEEERNPLLTSTYGLGELISDALDRGCTEIIMGIGGSATNDGGAGMAMALGAALTDGSGDSIGLGGGMLNRLQSIRIDGMKVKIKNTSFLIACDVSNRLCGENGASMVFGPQKGADAKAVKILDENLLHYSSIIKRDLQRDVREVPGAGAAGGLGAGLMAFCGARLSKGIDIIMELLEVEEKIKQADIVITGEGRIDAQTIHGKVPVGIAALAKKYNKPVFVIAGYSDKGADLVYDYGIDAVISSIVGPMTLQEAINESHRLIEEASERLFRIIKAILIK